MAVRPSERAYRLAADLETLDLHGRLGIVCSSGSVVFTTAFGPEDQLLTHHIAKGRHPVRVVTLDTGRLFPETYALWAATEARYGIRIRAYFPQAANVEPFLARHGIDGFRASVAARRSCCFVRKVEPLARALAGVDIWMTGLRASQSPARAQTPLAAFDEQRPILKVNPLADWSRDRVMRELAVDSIPINPLHDRGFASIGCAPCTRPIGPGEPERAGRWWWEEETRKECGLHLAGDGRLVRHSGIAAASDQGWVADSNALRPHG